MHQNRSISLFSTPFDHFHFHPLVTLNCYPHLIPCLSTVELTSPCKNLHKAINHPFFGGKGAGGLNIKNMPVVKAQNNWIDSNAI